MGFSDDIANFVKKANGNADAVVRKTVLDIGTRLVERTPVGDTEYWVSLNPRTNIKTHEVEYGRKPPEGYAGGHARANWQHAVGAPVISEVIGTDKEGDRTIAEIQSSIAASPPGAVHYIVNSVPYIQALEDGHSRQCPPNGMVAKTALEFGGIVDAAAQGVNK